MGLMDTLGFVEFLYDGLEGFVYGATKGPGLRPDGKHNFAQRYFEWPAQRDDLVEWISAASESSEVYVSPSVMGKRNASKAAFKASNVVWAEFDGNAPDSYEKDPSVKVISSSGKHQHVYWRLEEPITDFKRLEGINHNLAITLGADISGWECVQLLRPVGSINHGLGKDREAMPVQALEEHDYRYADSTFQVLGSVPTLEETEFDAEVIDPTATILKYAWTDTGAALLQKSMPSDRSNALMSLAYEMAEMGMSDSEIYAMVAHVDNRWGKFKGREDSNLRYAQIVRIARSKYPQVESGAEYSDYPQTYGLKSFLEADVQIEWVVEGMILKDSYNLFTGASGVGKTQYTLQWCIHLALGKDFLGYKITKPYKVIFMSLEMGHAALKVFLSDMGKKLTNQEVALLEENFLILPHGEPWWLDKHEGQLALNGYIESHQPDGIFIDSVGSAMAGSVSAEEPVRAFMAYNDHIRKKYGIFTWMIHHMRKATGDNKNPTAQDDVYGNQYLFNRADSVQSMFKGGKEGLLTVKPQKMRLAELGKSFNIERGTNLTFEYSGSTPVVGVPVKDPMFVPKAGTIEL